MLRPRTTGDSTAAEHNRGFRNLVSATFTPWSNHASLTHAYVYVMFVTQECHVSYTLSLYRLNVSQVTFVCHVCMLRVLLTLLAMARSLLTYFAQVLLVRMISFLDPRVRTAHSFQSDDLKQRRCVSWNYQRWTVFACYLISFQHSAVRHHVRVPENLASRKDWGWR